MAMMQLGMGETGGTGGAVTTTAPTGVDKFVAGAKTWLSPSTVPDTFAAWWAAIKASPGTALMEPGLWGFLAVPAAAAAAVALAMGAKRRRTRNPGRRAAYSRRRRRNPRRKGRRFVAAQYNVGPAGSKGQYWAVYDNRTHKYVSPASQDYRAQVQDAARMERAQRKGNPRRKSAGSGGWVLWEAKPGRVARPVAFGSKAKMAAEGRRWAGIYTRNKFTVERALSRKTNPKRRTTKKQQKTLFGGMVGTYSDPSWGAATRIVRRRKSRTAGKRSRSRGTHRVKNGRSYILRGSMPGPSYTPGPGKVFTLGGRKGVVKSVVADGNSKWVNFRRSVDGTTGMSLANFRQAARVENPGQRDAPPGYLLEVPGKRPVFYRGRGAAMDKAIASGMRKMAGKSGTFAVTDSISARTYQYDRTGARR
jgi:hypothetical protein